MNRYELSKYEKETIIRWSEAEDTAYIYTASDIEARRLDRLCNEYPDAIRCVWADSLGYGRKYECNRRSIAFKKPVSEARKAAARRNSPFHPRTTKGIGASAPSDDKQ